MKHTGMFLSVPGSLPCQGIRKSQVRAVSSIESPEDKQQNHGFSGHGFSVATQGTLSLLKSWVCGSHLVL